MTVGGVLLAGAGSATALLVAGIIRLRYPILPRRPSDYGCGVSLTAAVFLLACVLGLLANHLRWVP